MGTLKHYRPCRQNWHCFIRRGYQDFSVANIMENVKDVITKTFNELLNKETLQQIKARVT